MEDGRNVANSEIFWPVSLKVEIGSFNKLNTSSILKIVEKGVASEYSTPRGQEANAARVLSSEASSFL